MLFSYLFNTTVMANSNACTDQPYAPGTHKNVGMIFKNEYSFFASGEIVTSPNIYDETKQLKNHDQLKIWQFQWEKNFRRNPVLKKCPYKMMQ